MKKRKTSFSVFDQKRAAEEVRILQERCGFPSDEDFIHALDCDYIEGLDYGRHDVKIANRIYSYNKGAAKRRFKYPRKGIKMDRTTEDIAAPVPPEIMKHYKDIYLDIDILFVNKTAFLLAILRDIIFLIVDLCLPVLLNECRM